MSSNRQALAQRLASPKFRRTLRRADIANGLAFQLRAMMKERGWSQYELARRSGIAQPTISNYVRGYEKYSVETLDRLADTFDVNLGVRFEPYSDLVNYHIDLSPDRTLVPRYNRDVALREMQSDSSGDLHEQTRPAQLMPGHTLIAYQAPFPGQDSHIITLSDRQGTGAGTEVAIG